MPPIPPTGPTDPEWNVNWQETSQLRDWWTLYRCSYGTTIPGGFFGVMDATAQSELHDASKAFQIAAYSAGYRVADPQVESDRACPDGINGATCMPDGTDCSLHNYGIALDPEQGLNPHLYTAYPDEGTLFAACKWTKAQVQAVEAIKNTDGEQMWRWLGWSIGDTQHWQANVPPERTTVDWSTVPGANAGTNLGQSLSAGPFTEAQTGVYTIQDTVDPDNFTPGSTYLLMCSAQIGGSDNASNGPTFDIGIGTGTGVSDRLSERSRRRLEPDIAAVDQQVDGLERYFYFGVHTIPQFPVGYSFRMYDQATSTAYADNIQWSWIKLDGVDYEYVEDLTRAEHVLATPTERASLTFTSQADDYLVLADTSFYIDTMSHNVASRVEIDTVAKHADLQLEGEDTFDQANLVHLFVEPLTAAEHTIRTLTWDIETAVTSFLNDYVGSAIFALRLGSLNSFVFEQSSAPTHDAANDWHSASLVTGTAPVGEHLVLCHIIGDTGNAGRYGRTRLTLDGTATPTGRDARGVIHANDATDMKDDTLAQVVTLDGEALALDGWVTSSAGWVWQDGIVIALGFAASNQKRFGGSKFRSRGTILFSG